MYTTSHAAVYEAVVGFKTFNVSALRMRSTATDNIDIHRQHRHPAFAANFKHMLLRMIHILYMICTYSIYIRVDTYAQFDMSTGAMGNTLHMTVLMLLGHSCNFISLHRVVRSNRTHR